MVSITQVGLGLHRLEQRALALDRLGRCPSPSSQRVLAAGAAVAAGPAPACARRGTATRDAVLAGAQRGDAASRSPWSAVGPTTSASRWRCSTPGRAGRARRLRRSARSAGCRRRTSRGPRGRRPPASAPRPTSPVITTMSVTACTVRRLRRPRTSGACGAARGRAGAGWSRPPRTPRPGRGTRAAARARPSARAAGRWRPGR